MLVLKPLRYIFLNPEQSLAFLLTENTLAPGDNKTSFVLNSNLQLKTAICLSMYGLLLNRH